MDLNISSKRGLSRYRISVSYLVYAPHCVYLLSHWIDPPESKQRLFVWISLVICRRCFFFWLKQLIQIVGATPSSYSSSSSSFFFFFFYMSLWLLMDSCYVFVDFEIFFSICFIDIIITIFTFSSFSLASCWNQAQLKLFRLRIFVHLFIYIYA